MPLELPVPDDSPRRPGVAAPPVSFHEKLPEPSRPGRDTVTKERDTAFPLGTGKAPIRRPGVAINQKHAPGPTLRPPSFSARRSPSPQPPPVKITTPVSATGGQLLPPSSPPPSRREPFPERNARLFTQWDQEEAAKLQESQALQEKRRDHFRTQQRGEGVPTHEHLKKHKEELDEIGNKLRVDAENLVKDYSTTFDSLHREEARLPRSEQSSPKTPAELKLIRGLKASLAEKHEKDFQELSDKAARQSWESQRIDSQQEYYNQNIPLQAEQSMRRSRRQRKRETERTESRKGGFRDVDTAVERKVFERFDEGTVNLLKRSNSYLSGNNLQYETMGPFDVKPLQRRAVMKFLGEEKSDSSGVKWILDNLQNIIPHIPVPAGAERAESGELLFPEEWTTGKLHQQWLTQSGLDLRLLDVGPGNVKIKTAMELMGIDPLHTTKGQVAEVGRMLTELDTTTFVVSNLVKLAIEDLTPLISAKNEREQAQIVVDYLRRGPKSFWENVKTNRGLNNEELEKWKRDPKNFVGADGKKPLELRVSDKYDDGQFDQIDKIMADED